MNEGASAGPAPNAASVICDRQARRAPDAPAIVEVAGNVTRTYSFAQLEDLSRRFASVLRAQGIGPGDRVALLLDQGVALPIAALACWRIGAIAVPVPGVFASDGLQRRLEDSGAVAAVVEPEGAARLAALPQGGAPPGAIWIVGDGHAGARDFWADIGGAPTWTSDVPGGTAPAFLMYTSGTTGRAKGAIHSHASLLGSLPGVAAIHGPLAEDDRAWCPAEWTWIAGFTGILLAFLSFGRPVLAWRAPRPFDAQAVVTFLAERRVRNTLLTPTMLRLIQQAGTPAGLNLRSLLVTGEPVGEALHRFCEETLGVAASEAYGQTECAPITVNNPRLGGGPRGALGVPAPGLEVAVVDVLGRPVAAGETGEIAVRTHHPSMFLGYWNDPAVTAEKVRGDWMLTGDEARRDQDGALWFVGRNDDVIKSSGYRIGPTEIEARLMQHPAVALVAAIGLPHPTRGAEVTAVIQLKPGVAAAAELADDLLAFGRVELERHERPRRVIFVDAMPLTITGKLMRAALRQRLLQPSQETPTHAAT